MLRMGGRHPRKVPHPAGEVSWVPASAGMTFVWVAPAPINSNHAHKGFLYERVC